MSWADWSDQDNAQYISLLLSAKVPLELFDPLIIDLMREARLWCEKLSKKNRYPTDLTGLCAKASAKLFSFLQAEEIDDVVLVETDNEDGGSHCFVLYQDRYILDITATQFGYVDPCLVIDTAKLYDAPYYWRVENKFDSIVGLKKFQRESGWPPDQIPR